MNLQNGEPKALVVRPEVPIRDGRWIRWLFSENRQNSKEVVTDQQTQKGENEFASFCRNKNGG